VDSGDWKENSLTRKELLQLLDKKINVVSLYKSGYCKVYPGCTGAGYLVASLFPGFSKKYKSCTPAGYFVGGTELK
jgi:hypothetical protein